MYIVCYKGNFYFRSEPVIITHITNQMNSRFRRERIRNGRNVIELVVRIFIRSVNKCSSPGIFGKLYLWKKDFTVNRISTLYYIPSWKSLRLLMGKNQTILMSSNLNDAITSITSKPSLISW